MSKTITKTIHKQTSTKHPPTQYKHTKNLTCQHIHENNAQNYKQITTPINKYQSITKTIEKNKIHIMTKQSQTQYNTKRQKI